MASNAFAREQDDKRKAYREKEDEEHEAYLEKLKKEFGITCYSKKYAQHRPEKAIDIMILSDGFVDREMGKFQKYAAGLPFKLLPKNANGTTGPGSVAISVFTKAPIILTSIIIAPSGSA